MVSQKYLLEESVTR